MFSNETFFITPKRVMSISIVWTFKKYMQEDFQKIHAIIGGKVWTSFNSRDHKYCNIFKRTYYFVWRTEKVVLPKECPTITSWKSSVPRSGLWCIAFSIKCSSCNFSKMYCAACTIPLWPNQSSLGGYSGNVSPSAFKSVKMS